MAYPTYIRRNDTIALQTARNAMREAYYAQFVEAEAFERARQAQTSGDPEADPAGVPPITPELPSEAPPQPEPVAPPMPIDEPGAAPIAPMAAASAAPASVAPPSVAASQLRPQYQQGRNHRR